MTEVLTRWRNEAFHFLYKNIFRRMVFRLDPENVHDAIVIMGRLLGHIWPMRIVSAWILDYKNPMLKQTIRGIEFSNPIGLSAGFDKNAELTKILPAVGFGFAELGSITGEPCSGNPKPRLWRLKKSKSILVYYGLKNPGCEAVAKRLAGKKFSIPMGISIAKTNSPDTVEIDAGVEDYFKAYKTFSDSKIGDYYTINISCPNAYGGCPFVGAAELEKLLERVASIPKTKPIFIKISPDLSREQIDNIIALSRKYKIDGFICSNLTKNRNNAKILDDNVPEVGGMSGKIVEDLANELIRYIRRNTGNEFVIIGCGGVFSAEDAYKKIKSGASLIQLITGMIYEGPQLISSINQGLAVLLRRDGFNSLAEAVGVDVSNEAISR